MKKIKRKINNLYQKIKRIPNSIILCIRFPFLYPRNRFTGLHYNNHKILDLLKELHKDSVDITYNRENPIGKRTITTIINKKKYNLYRILKFYHNNILQWIHCIPTSTELNLMDKGWRKAFGIQICKEIRKALLKEGGLKALYSYRIMDIKEKYGSLRWYDGNSFKSIHNIIRKYEAISEKTCIVCGKPATKISKGWISPYCDNCIGNRKYVDINSPNLNNELWD